VSDGDFTPTDADLIAYDQGLLPEDRIDAVTRWLEAHPEGEERLRSLSESSHDHAVEAMRHASKIGDELEQLADVTTHVINRVLHQAAGLSATAATVPERIRDYRLLSKLGQGGMAAVYRARHDQLQRDVAIKLLPARLAADPEFRARFQREMAVMGQLDHPNLVRAHDAGVEGEHLFLVMELLDGQDLATIVRTHGPLRVADACEAVRQAALGLHQAHQHGIVHRDVKPSNLFLTRAGVVKIIDVGLARATDQRLAVNMVSSVHAIMGTPEFMAPEQWQNPNVGHAADVYSLGCTLFFLLTGRPPFQGGGDSWVAMFEAHRHEPAPDLRALRSDVPTALAKVVARTLSKSPEQRPATAAKVAELLAPFPAKHDFAGLFSAPPGGTTPVIVAVSARARPRRTPWIAVVVALLAAVGIGSIWYFTRKPNTPPNTPETGANVISSIPAQAVYPLELTGKEHVELGNTAGLIDLNGSFTVEMWVKFDKGIQYFVADETWPGVGPPSIQRTHGWVLRIEPDLRLNFNAAVAREWYSVRGPVIAFDERWHHLAISKSPQRLQMFLDGKIYATANTADIQFVNCPLNLFLGPSNAQDPRRIHAAFKAFRVSGRQLYTQEFTPPARFDRTGDTLVLLDFGVGEGNTLPDLSGGGHHGTISGGHWVTSDRK
jgi:serine/threonine protein kinase